MVLCPKCNNKIKFMQYNKTLGIKRKITIKSGVVTPGAVLQMKPGEKEKDGLYCWSCNYQFSPNLQEFGIPEFGKTIKEDYKVGDLVKRVFSEMESEAELKYQYEKQNEGVYSELLVSKKIKEWLESTGVSKGYIHQIEAINEIRKGKNIVIQTKTASGKSLCYQIPVIEAMVEHPIKPSVIMVFPTKALAYDQTKKLASLSMNSEIDLESPFITVNFGGTSIKIANLNGDTKDKFKNKSDFYNADILITNPDFIHANMFNHLYTKEGSWKPFFTRLKYIIIDEIHQYRGVFGANVALLLRRLSIICKHLGSNPTYICSSATLSNPIEHVQKLTGKSFELVEKDGAPTRDRHFFLVNPKPKEDGSPKEPSTVALSLLFGKGILFNKDYQVQTIVFGRSRKGVANLFNRSKKVLQRLSPEFNLSRDDAKNMLASFIGTYREDERRIVLDRVISKEIAVIYATNALELGIDIGSLSSSILFDYPGTSTSLLQQVGRAGREKESMIFLILKDDPLQQYFFRNYNYFFNMLKSFEPTILNFENGELLEHALKALRFEEKSLRANFQDEDIELLFGSKGLNIWKSLPRDTGDDESEKEEIYIKKGIRNCFSNFDVECEGRKIGTIDELTVGRDLHPGAIYESNEGVFESKRIDYVNRVVTLERKNEEEVDYYTICPPNELIEIETEIPRGPIFFGDIKITRSFEIYYKLSYSQNKSLGTGFIGESRARPVQKKIASYWIKIPSKTIKTDKDPLEYKTYLFGGIKGLRNLLSIWVPQRARCDRSDLSCNYQEIGDNICVFIYDNHLVYEGYSEVFERRYYEILQDCFDFVNLCDCENGCPKCLHLTTRFDNNEINKKATIEILKGLLEKKEKSELF